MKSLIALLGLCSVAAMADYSSHEMADEFAQSMAEEHGFDKKAVLAVLSKAERQQSILDAMSRPAEKTKQWFEYRDIFVQPSRIEQGVAFWQEHKATITRASEKYGVAPEVIVAIIGVETRYGRHAGSYRVIDALTTLGFDYPSRGKFFRKELAHYLLMTQEQEQDPLLLKGSYAGAMGYGQFIPSSYRAYAVDFDGDNKVDIWQNPVDAIGSVANYFRAHRWQTGEPVFARARIAKKHDESVLNSKARPEFSLSELKKKGYTPVDEGFASTLKAVPLTYVGDHGTEFWLGFDNFYVITRYNRSHMYAKAVWLLGREIKAQMEKS